MCRICAQIVRMCQTFNRGGIGWGLRSPECRAAREAAVCTWSSHHEDQRSTQPLPVLSLHVERFGKCGPPIHSVLHRGPGGLRYCDDRGNGSPSAQAKFGRHRQAVPSNARLQMAQNPSLRSLAASFGGRLSACMAQVPSGSRFTRFVDRGRSGTTAGRRIVDTRFFVWCSSGRLASGMVSRCLGYGFAHESNVPFNVARRVARLSYIGCSPSGLYKELSASTQSSFSRVTGCSSGLSGVWVRGRSLSISRVAPQPQRVLLAVSDSVLSSRDSSTSRCSTAIDTQVATIFHHCCGQTVVRCGSKTCGTLITANDARSLRRSAAIKPRRSSGAAFASTDSGHAWLSRRTYSFENEAGSGCLGSWSRVGLEAGRLARSPSRVQAWECAI